MVVSDLLNEFSETTRVNLNTYWAIFDENSIYDDIFEICPLYNCDFPNNIGQKACFIHNFLAINVLAIDQMVEYVATPDLYNALS